MTTAAVFAPSTGGVLVSSPSLSFRQHVKDALPQSLHPVHEVPGGAEALAELESGDWQALYLDRQLPDLDAEEVASIVRSRFPEMVVILLDSSDPEQTHRDPKIPRLVRPAARCEPLPGMIGNSEAMLRLYRLTRLVAARSTTVLILGATGTGKELVARAIHQLSPRAARTCVVVNCAAIPESLLESELFGYVRGAFTGAVQTYAGRIYSAQGGTLFLDEIGELPLSLQAKLLRFLEQKEVQRLGSSEPVKVDVRVVAATNANLVEQVERRAFREDLYYRLAAFPLNLPTLAQRSEDIIPLAEHFLRVLAASGVSCLAWVQRLRTD
jgi:transcriptional regulator with GAF, ATPase, and Fis domain